ncbi:DUF397 domain-containing protein [Streptomyces sp. NPDC091279]|uniref:DUF397 domain-containing protein n=1 Tax=Streptomyces sp. NPDC091279 TaxID=3365983 RepID=UPI0037FCFFEC
MSRKVGAGLLCPPVPIHEAERESGRGRPGRGHVPGEKSASGKEGDCVELAPYQGAVAIRDSKAPHGPAILYPRASVAALIAGIQAGALGC